MYNFFLPPPPHTHTHTHTLLNMLVRYIDPVVYKNHVKALVWWWGDNKSNMVAERAGATCQAYMQLDGETIVALN